MNDNSGRTDGSVLARLLAAAGECFVADDYHKVTTGAVAGRITVSGWRSVRIIAEGEKQ
ncbi:hypothetical protein [Methylomarinum vadi]|uniref:hypothetical protein n=1 Tax=Methylomarinum vadi TaxID=438855 RepID=UPI001F16381E|nr:hypothetical protein [Methylomarinum vadi]